MKNHRKKTILLSPVGGQAISGIVKYFKNRDFTVIGMDSDRNAIGKFFVDRFVDVPGVDDSGYKDKVLRTIGDHFVDIFVSWLDSEVAFWTKERSAGKIPKDIARAFAFNFQDDLETLLDKLAFAAEAGKKGFCVPETVSMDVFMSQGKKYYPSIVKPRTGSGSRNIQVLNDDKDLEWLCHRSGQNNKFLIVQKFIDGAEFTVDLFSEKGALINSVARERERHKGISLAGRVVNDSSIDNVVKKFCSDFKLDGLNNVQLIKSHEKVYVIECNPRPSGTIMLSVASGTDLLNNLLERSAGKEPTVYGTPKPLKMVRYYEELYYE